MRITLIVLVLTVSGMSQTAEQARDLKNIKYEGYTTKKQVAKYKIDVANAKVKFDAAEASYDASEDKVKDLKKKCKGNGCSIDKRKKCTHSRSKRNCYKITYFKQIAESAKLRDILSKSQRAYDGLKKTLSSKEAYLKKCYEDYARIMKEIKESE